MTSYTKTAIDESWVKVERMAKQKQAALRGGIITPRDIGACYEDLLKFISIDIYDDVIENVKAEFYKCLEK